MKKILVPLVLIAMALVVIWWGQMWRVYLFVPAAGFLLLETYGIFTVKRNVTKRI